MSPKKLKWIRAPPCVAAENSNEGDNGGTSGGEHDGQAGVGAGWYNQPQPISLVLLKPSATLSSS